MRTDPITGKRAWHNGIDIASKEGAPVIAMAPGVVTFAGTKPGYGKVVDIDHGGGIKTRYAHQRELSVKTGYFVRKGSKSERWGVQVAQLGHMSTMRSTRMDVRSTPLNSYIKRLHRAHKPPLTLMRPQKLVRTL